MSCVIQLTYVWKGTRIFSVCLTKSTDCKEAGMVATDAKVLSAPYMGGLSSSIFSITVKRAGNTNYTKLS